MSMKHVPCFRASELLEAIPMQDTHIHTRFSDGRNSYQEYIDRAYDLGLETIAFTEHADDTSPWFPEYVETLRRAHDEHAGKLRVCVSAEVKAAEHDGTPNMSLARMAHVDYLVGVIHRYPMGGDKWHEFDELSAEQALDLDYEISKGLASHPDVDVLGHPGGVYAHYYGSYDESRMRNIVDVANQNGTVIEINSHERYQRHFKMILDRCFELDALITLGSDAHGAEELGDVITATREWVEARPSR